MKLRKVGLIIMLSPVAFYLIFAITPRLSEYADVSTNLYMGLLLSSPCLLVTAASCLWPRQGGAVAVVVSLLLVVLSYIAVATSVDWDHRDFSFLTDIFAWTFPYVILLIGSIIAYVSARKATIFGLQPSIRAGIARFSKLGKAGLLMMLLPGILYFILCTTLGWMIGDSKPVINIFQALLFGSAFAAPSLLLTAAAWRWPYRGSSVAIGVSLVVLILSVVRIPFLSIILLIYTFPYLSLFVGNILFFISVRKYSKLSP